VKLVSELHQQILSLPYSSDIQDLTFLYNSGIFVINTEEKWFSIGVEDINLLFVFTSHEDQDVVDDCEGTEFHVFVEVVIMMDKVYVFATHQWKTVNFF
jgi:hypothetical protein